MKNNLPKITYTLNHVQSCNPRLQTATLSLICAAVLAFSKTQEYTRPLSIKTQDTLKGNTKKRGYMQMYSWFNLPYSVLVIQWCPTLCEPMNCSLPGSCPWDRAVKNTEVSCHSLLQGILLTQRLNPGLLHCRQILYHLSHQRTYAVETSTIL